MAYSQKDYSRFRPHAQADFISIYFKLQSRSNLKTVQPVLNRILNLPDDRNASVDLFDWSEGGSVSEFAFRIQDPQCAGHVRHVIAELKRRFDLAEEPTITGIEVSLDMIRRKGTTDEELADLTTHMHVMSAYRPNANHRTYHGFTGSAEAVPVHQASLRRMVLAGHCIAVGSQRDHDSKRGHQQADPISSRTYHKTTDDGSGLPQDQHRARTERTLQGAGLPFDTLDKLNAFNFSDLHDLFSFRKLKDDLNPLVASAYRHRVMDFSAQERSRRDGGGTRKHHPATVADSALNAIMARALRALTKRWQKPYSCGNSDNSDHHFLETASDCASSANNYLNPVLNPSTLPSLPNLGNDGNNNDPTNPAASFTQDEGEARVACDGGSLVLPLLSCRSHVSTSAPIKAAILNHQRETAFKRHTSPVRVHSFFEAQAP